jgi:hypothetical protein
VADDGLRSMDFSMEDMRRKLIHKREKRYGANSPKGHACSNIVEQLQAMVNYVRPAWATHHTQTLPWMIQQQMKRLAQRDSTDRNIDDLSLARLREVLDYDPETGALTWRFRLSPNSKLGEPAGQIGAHGYRKIRLDGKYYPASHLAWFHYYGEPPAKLIDHKDRDKGNDRIENLRLATHSENARNRKGTSLSTTGLKGAARFNSPKNAKKFRSTITIDGKRIHLGQFATAEEAHEAYSKKVAELHGEFGCTE